ncbi:hypothetical protein ABE424_17265 [Stenotrophomonas sp. TWI1149]|uniref:hypothetical protein n=1 Tax=unclassified Stenotrophomonas TaxID=196198 RepID=UPI00320904F9
MNIPRLDETKAYFLQYNLRILHETRGSRHGWLVSGADLPLDGRWFSSLGELWLEWMDYAAERLQIEKKVERFMAAYTAGDAARRAELTLALDRSSKSSSELIAEMFAGLPAPSTDQLGSDWQLAFDQVWESRDAGFCFAARVETALKKLHDGFRT